MRFVAVKSEAKQASGVIFRTRDVLVGQMLARKPPMLIIVAVANKNARIA